MEMVSLYTETLGDLLENKGYGTDHENQSLTEVLNLMDKFPNFVFGEDLDINFKEMFIEKFDIREIGSETEELFLHHWREKTKKLLIKFVPKITMWLENFNDLFKFTVSLTITDNSIDSNSNTYYLNPVNNSTTNLKVQDKSTNDANKNRTITRDVLQTVWGKTRADILNKILEVKDVYNECLDSFEPIFMGLF